ncbi:MAG: GAF domain-containing sensor histidine kinase [Gemmatimonadota bacterium]|nr:MAG: GAF domain-containing sensor histidine kinase [Gemmatimonadota bacterium]
MVQKSQDDNRRIWSRVEQLSRAAIRITAERDLERLLQHVADSARDVIGSKYAALAILAPKGMGVSSFVASGITPELHEEIGSPPLGKGVLGLLISDPRPLRIADLSQHPAAAGFPPNHPPMKSFLGVPILGRDHPIGHLYLTEKADSAEFTDEDEAVAVMLAGHAAVAVENARVHEQEAHLLQELKGMQQSRDRFYAMINHELRNALTATYGWADLWLRKAGDEAPREAVEVYESAEQTLTLLEDLLQLSRLDADKLHPVVQDADAQDVVRDAVRSVEPAATRKNVVIETTGIDGEILCRTDPHRVRQILINLLTNAVRHSPEGESISVDVRLDDQSMRFDVIDQGDGISAEDQAAIFEAFEQGREQKERGTGLGLALSRQLARLLGGDLGVESRLGYGARFILRLPRFTSDS